LLFIFMTTPNDWIGFDAVSFLWSELTHRPISSLQEQEDYPECHRTLSHRLKRLGQASLVLLQVKTMVGKNGGSCAKTTRKTGTRQFRKLCAVLPDAKE
jgi:hypothetical protein